MKVFQTVLLVSLRSLADEVLKTVKRHIVSSWEYDDNTSSGRVDDRDDARHCIVGRRTSTLLLSVTASSDFKSVVCGP